MRWGIVRKGKRSLSFPVALHRTENDVVISDCNRHTSDVHIPLSEIPRTSCNYHSDTGCRSDSHCGLQRVRRSRLLRSPCMSPYGACVGRCWLPRNPCILSFYDRVRRCRILRSPCTCSISANIDRILLDTSWLPRCSIDRTMPSLAATAVSIACVMIERSHWYHS